MCWTLSLNQLILQQHFFFSFFLLCKKFVISSTVSRMAIAVDLSGTHMSVTVNWNTIFRTEFENIVYNIVEFLVRIEDGFKLKIQMSNYGIQMQLFNAILQVLWLKFKFYWFKFLFWMSLFELINWNLNVSDSNSVFVMQFF